MLSLGAAAAAHDFWLAPDRYRLPAAGGVAKISFIVGHAGDSAPWAVGTGRIVSFDDIAPPRNRTLMETIFPAAGEASALPEEVALTLKGEGAHIISLVSNDASIELDPEAFNNYIEEEGLYPAIEDRWARDAEAAPGRELYSRRAKSLIQVGQALSDVSTPLGHTLEITPLEHPGALAENEPLRARIDWKGAPLAGATVDLESLSVGVAPERKFVSDENGIIEVPLPKTGAWKLDVVWTEPLADREEADFRTVFASLTFAFDQPTERDGD